MKQPIAIILRAFGVFCLACWLLPLALYRIFNAGTAAFLLLGAATLLLPHLWDTALAPHPLLRKSIAVIGCAGLAFCLLLSALIARRAWFSQPPPGANLPVVVLGGKVNGDEPSLMLRRRLNAAADYLARNPEAVCVVSGGQGPDEEYPEAQVMRNYLLQSGIADDRILVEDQSANTRQNLTYSAAILREGGYADGGRIVIATDSFHQLRASVFASAAGLDSYNISSLTPWGLMPSYWLREILGVSWAWLSTRLGRA